jgi:hypothetical protein
LIVNTEHGFPVKKPGTTIEEFAATYDLLLRLLSLVKHQFKRDGFFYHNLFQTALPPNGAPDGFF